MPDLSVMQDILILLLLALGSGLVCSRMHLSPIVGYLLSGVVAGPYGLHLIKAVHEVEMIAEVGVILLLFTIGLEFSLTRIFRLKSIMLLAGPVQILLTSVIVYTICLLLDFSHTSSLALSLTISLSSTALVLKMLLEKGEIDTAHGRLSLGILLLQDLAVVVFLIVFPVLSADFAGFSPFAFVRGTLLIAGLFIAVRFLLNPLLRNIATTRSRELFSITILCLVLGTAWVTAQAGLSLALGAFLAGLALAESPYSHQALSDILPFRDTFLALFFISVGMLVDIGLLADNWYILLALVVSVSLIKTATGTIAGLVARYPLRIGLLSGLLLFQVGEFSFVLLKKARELELVSPDVYQLTLALIALTILASPFVAARAHEISGWTATRFRRYRPPHAPAQEAQEKTANLGKHVIIAGYGVAGKNVAKALRQINIPYIFVEINGESVRKAKEAGEFIIYGDATSPALLEELGIDRAAAFVIAINDPSALVRAIKAGHKCNPGVFILVRSRFAAEINYLHDIGANEIIADELEASLQLSSVLLRQFDIAEGNIMQVLSGLREKNALQAGQEEIEPDKITGYLSVLKEGNIEFQAIPDDSPCIGRSLSELNFRNATGTMVVGAIRKERTIPNPEPEFLIEQGDTLMLLGSPQEILKAREFIHGHPV